MCVCVERQTLNQKLYRPITIVIIGTEKEVQSEQIKEGRLEIETGNLGKVYRTNLVIINSIHFN